jgi:hypothetical protein
VDRRVRVHENHEWAANRPDSERSRGGSFWIDQVFLSRLRDSNP